MWTQNSKKKIPLTFTPLLSATGLILSPMGRGRVLQFFQSRKLALLLLCALTAVFSLSQIPSFEENLSFFISMSIFLSVFLVLNILFCVSQRAPRILNDLRNPPMYFSQGTISKMPCHSSFPSCVPANELNDALSNIFKKRRYKIHFELNHNTLKLSAVKYGFSKFASPLFHVSLVVILAGALYGHLFGMKGYVELLEGQPFEEKHANYALLSEGAYFRENHKNFMLLLSDFSPSYYEDGSPQDYAATLVAANNHHRLRKHALHVNQPAVINGVRFYYNNHGYAVLLKVKSKGMEKYEWIAFEEKEDRYTRKGDLKSFGFPFSAVFSPNRSLSGGKNQKHETKDPWLFIQLSEREKAAVPLGGHRYFLGTSVDFLEIKRWVGFSVVKNPGLPVIYFGFALSVGSLFLVYFFVPRTACVVANLSAGLVSMGIKSEKYVPFLQDEFQDLAHKVLRKTSREKKQKTAC